MARSYHEMAPTISIKCYGMSVAITQRNMGRVERARDNAQGDMPIPEYGLEAQLRGDECSAGARSSRIRLISAEYDSRPRSRPKGYIADVISRAAK